MDRADNTRAAALTLKVSRRLYKIGACWAFTALCGATAGTSVTTYHNDNLRTGWTQTETVLTPANVGSSAFGLLGQVSLDQQVDAQPLFLPSQSVNGGTHDAVYVATENNSVGIIDAQTGTLLLARNLGTPVDSNDLPDHCGNNSDKVGITSTPVIDPATSILYVMTLTSENGQQVYRLHALDTGTLADRMPNVQVSATGALVGGGTVTFNAAYQRQRPALLLSSGTVYAGFGSYCDMGGNVSRGWMLGWNAANLAPLPAGALLDRKATSTNNFFMSSIWMSGAGPAADPAGNLYFTTSNSDPSGTSYNPVTNLSESVVRMAPDLSKVDGIFTPLNHAAMDQNDGDLGAGGVLLLPPQGTSPNLAITEGKWNGTYLIARDRLQYGTAGKPAKPLINIYNNTGCWCAESYFGGSDGVGRVVVSYGRFVQTWKLNPGPRPTLTFEYATPNLGSGQDPGFFTSVSSNGTQPNTAVIWAVPHPGDNDTNSTIYLKAFDPSNGVAQIFSGAAGNWPHAKNANSNVVPLVADGRVFVATYGQLAIFGLSNGQAPIAAKMIKLPSTRMAITAKHQLFGMLVSVTGHMLAVRLRDGRQVTVDAGPAAKTFNLADISPGHGVQVRGSTGNGRFSASAVLHAKDSPMLWDQDY